MRVADYIFKYLADRGVKHTFLEAPFLPREEFEKWMIVKPVDGFSSFDDKK